MKKIITLIVVIALGFSASSLTLIERLNQLPGVKAEAKTPAPGFTESFTLWISQPLDHQHPEKGNFTQRAFLSHRGFKKTMVMTTEGYSADYADNAYFEEELAALLQSNQVVVEHRYFSQSRPEGQPWDYLTVENAAADHHHIITLLKKIYTGKWVTTGISKGGQTALYHRTFFPDDADATVAYVAPYNIAQEDPRELWFLKNVGDADTRNKITAFQQLVLKNRQEVVKLLQNQVTKRNLTWAMSPDSTLDYMVLEYPFSYWQWGHSSDKIPSANASARDIYMHLNAVVGLDNFSHPGMDGTEPFFYQAYTEIGYYGYDTTGVGNLLSIKSGYISNQPLAPKGVKYQFNPLTLQKVRDFIALKGNNIIYIYGGNDPWSASAALTTTATNALRVVVVGACHGVRISNMNAENRIRVMQRLNKWLK
jgi:hypothetical protein